MIDILLADRHALALSEHGEVFSWGSNDYGQLGHGDEAEKQPYARALLCDAKHFREAHDDDRTKDEELWHDDGSKNRWSGRWCGWQTRRKRNTWRRWRDCTAADVDAAASFDSASNAVDER